jgi:hypothetical protein
MWKGSNFPAYSIFIKVIFLWIPQACACAVLVLVFLHVSGLPVCSKLSFYVYDIVLKYHISMVHYLKRLLLMSRLVFACLLTSQVHKSI